MARPDITNAVRAVARYAHTPTERLGQAIMKILSYLIGTKSLGIIYARGSGLGLEVFADADYADKTTGRRSVSGIAVTLGGTVVSPASKTRYVVSLSTSEEECIPTGDGVKEALFVRVPFCLSVRPRRVEQALRSLRTTRGLRR